MKGQKYLQSTHSIFVLASPVMNGNGFSLNNNRSPIMQSQNSDH